jgi:hypothetical protein
MKWLLLSVIVAAVLVIGFFLYRNHISGDRLQFDPHAGDEIEKAKRG